MSQIVPAERASAPSMIWPDIRNASTSKSPRAVPKFYTCVLEKIARAKAKCGHAWIISNSI